MNNIKLLKYDRTDISEQIDVNKISKSTFVTICQHLSQVQHLSLLVFFEYMA